MISKNFKKNELFSSFFLQPSITTTYADIVKKFLAKENKVNHTQIFCEILRNKNL